MQVLYSLAHDLVEFSRDHPRRIIHPGVISVPLKLGADFAAVNALNPPEPLQISTYPNADPPLEELVTLRTGGDVFTPTRQSAKNNFRNFPGHTADCLSKSPIIPKKYPKLISAIYLSM